MLYQLSYASPSHPWRKFPQTKTKARNPSRSRADTLPLRTFHGTEIKVSTPPRAEQTSPGGKRAGSSRFM
jgi:hypothetical protein